MNDPDSKARLKADVPCLRNMQASKYFLVESVVSRNMRMDSARNVQAIAGKT